MTWDELLKQFPIEEIRVKIKKPLRRGEEYREGRLTGFKSGIIGGGHSKYKGGIPQSYDSTKRRFIRNPKVHVTYDVFEYHKTEISDWIDADNCEFEITDKNKAETPATAGNGSL